MISTHRTDIASGFRCLEYPCSDAGCAGSVIFIHGAGEWGNSLDQLDRVNRWGLPRLLAADAIDVNCHVVCPQLDHDGEWCSQRLQALVASVNTESRVLAVMGFSRGAKAVCNLISEHGVVAPLAVAIAGREDQSATCPLQGLRLVSIQGDQDPYPDMGRFLERCRHIGADVTEIILAGRGHFIAEEVFANAHMTSVLEQVGVHVDAYTWTGHTPQV